MYDVRVQHAYLRKRLDALDVSCDRLYRVTLWRNDAPPAAFASPKTKPPTASAQRFALLKQENDEQPSSDFASAVAGQVRLALFHDLYDRTFEQIFEEVLEVIDGQPGSYTIEVFYWDGDMYTPRSKGSGMGAREHFLYDYNPRGDLIRKAEPIHFTVE